MKTEVLKYISQADSDLLINAVNRCDKVDVSGIAKEFDMLLKMSDFRGAIKAQWRIIGAMSRTIVALEKQNVLMEHDYARIGRGRNSEK